LVCPPYDVISPEQQAAFYARHPHNAIRLELTEAEPGDRSDADRYARAGAWFSEWRASGILTPEARPALYAYSQEFAFDGSRRERRGLLAALRLEPWESRVVRPHERTLSGPKRDRLDLIRASHASLSP